LGLFYGGNPILHRRVTDGAAGGFMTP
jgi:hypothetical protein